MKSFRLRHFKHVAQARRALPATSFSATSSSSASPSIKEDHQIITIQSNDFHKAVDIQNKAPNHNKNNNNHQGPVIDQNTYANEQEEHLTGRCYVHFATHGALNSQRSQLENAMMVASLLKCTLIMPYVQLGKTLTWSTFDQLSRLSHQYDRECAYASNKKVQEEGLVCSEFSDLFDLRNVMVEARLKMINVKQFSSEIGVDLSNPSSSDSENFWSLVQQSNNVVSIKDQFHGCYLMYDSHGYLSPDSEKYGAHYDRARHALDKKRDVFDVLDLNDMRLKSSLLHVATNLSTAPIRKGTTIEFHGIKRSTPAYSTIYRFGSLDGLERITLSMNQKSLRNHIHSSMIYSNKVLHSVAQGKMGLKNDSWERRWGMDERERDLKLTNTIPSRNCS